MPVYDDTKICSMLFRDCQETETSSGPTHHVENENSFPFLIHCKITILLIFVQKWRGT